MGIDFCHDEMIYFCHGKRGGEQMSQKIGRPTESRKDIKLQIRVDKKTLDDIDACAEALQTNRSEIVRLGIKLVKSELKK